MSDDNKRLILWISAAVITAIIYGIHPVEDWWASVGLLLLIGLVLHQILGVPIVWIEGVDAWDKIGTVVGWSAALAGAWGISLIVPDASTGLRVGAAVICFFIAAFFLWLCDEIRWRSTPRVGRFRNPSNGYEENVGRAWLWCLLLGPIYFAAKGIWGHAAISLLLAIVTYLIPFPFFISWFIYPFFANAIVRKHYLRNGWVPADDTASPAGQPL